MLNSASNISPVFQMMLTKMSSDMRFVGIFYIITGGITCLSIIGALVGIPYIICGIRLRESASFFDNYSYGGDMGFLENAIERQSKFFFIQKILLIIGLVIIVLYIIFFIIFLSKFMGTLGSGYYPST